jgi:hypothetical protein
LIVLTSPGIAIRMWAWAAVLRVLKRIVPLESLVRLMHRRPAPGGRSPAFRQRIEDYMCMTGRFPWRPPSNCLERSLGAYRLLCEAAAAPELVIGLRRSDAQGLLGHVWVTVQGRALAERDDALAVYTPIATFDAGARRHSHAAGDPLRGMSFR